MKVLHAAAEVFPLVKTGGLADVVGALPEALIAAGADVRLVLPGLPAILKGMDDFKVVCELGAVFGAGRVTLRLGRLAHHEVKAYVIDAPYLYQRPGNPYLAPDGHEWTDNLQRFALLGWVAAHLAAGDHQNCALTFKLPEQPVTLAEGTKQFDPALARHEAVEM